jgi:putative SOS response-associated peptidase YedK
VCGRFTLRTPANVLIKQFGLDDFPSRPRYNIAPTQTVPVIRADNRKQVSMMRWGLIPSWATDPKIGYSMINCRSETAATKPAFRSAIKRRRCLILADGFYEWRKEGKTKQPIYIRRADERPFAFAGLWEAWDKGSEPIESCTIMTTAANDMLKPLHDRMPVILASGDYDAWLDPATTEIAYLYESIPPDELTMYPVNPIVNNARNETPECVQPT